MAADVSRAWASLRFQFRCAESQEQTLMVVEAPFLAREAVEAEAVLLASLPRQVSAETPFKIWWEAMSIALPLPERAVA